MHVYDRCSDFDGFSVCAFAFIGRDDAYDAIFFIVDIAAADFRAYHSFLKIPHFPLPLSDEVAGTLPNAPAGVAGDICKLPLLTRAAFPVR